MMESTVPPTSTHTQNVALETTSDTASTTTIPKTSFIHGTAVTEDDESVSREEFDDEARHVPEEGPFPSDVRTKTEDGSGRDRRHKKGASPPVRKYKTRYETQQPPLGEMSEADVGIFQKLDAEYDRAMEEREVSYAARYQSVRQSACFAVGFMVIYMTLGTVYFMKQADWTVQESLFFGIYTITTVGYGNLDNPETPAFQLYTIFFILIGMATLTIMLAQVYQCLALEAGRAQHHRDQTEMLRHGVDITAKTNKNRGRGGGFMQAINLHTTAPVVERVHGGFERVKNFFNQNEIGRAISVVLPFLGLVLIGAAVVGTLEGWTTVESLYFAVVSMTTVGYGDYFPTKESSRLFCIVWLPFSIGFMSLYLGNIAAFYIRLSDRNIARIERHLRRKIDGLKQRSELEREAARKRALRGQESPKRNSPRRSFVEEVPTDDAADRSDFQFIPQGASGATRRHSSDQERRNRVMQNYLGQHKKSLDGAPESTMSTMHDVLRTVHASMQSSAQTFKGGPESEYLSFRSSKLVTKSSLAGGGSVRKPSFALRVLVQERLSEIIAAEVAGYQNEVAIQDATLTITIGTLKTTAEKWLIPRRARRAFRAVAFEALYFVGEHGLITRGANALFDLNPFEFHGLFAPLLAALGDAETMEGWLASTEIQTEYDLRTTRTPMVDVVPSAEAAIGELSAGEKMIV
ncbi:hypothetical protein ACA910_019460 [Epithemia clementina (nom. ined.)]